MSRTRKLLLVAGAVTAVSAAGVGTAFAVAGGGDESEKQATGPGADKARAAALSITQGGTANAVERDSENGATWEVEITKPDGRTVDVRLDQQYQLVVVEGDSESESQDRGR
jgi:uncharacterized membrane protein YkoI